MTIQTKPGHFYSLCTTGACKVSASLNGQSYLLCSSAEPAQLFFRAISNEVELTDEHAFLAELPDSFKFAPVAVAGGGSGSSNNSGLRRKALEDAPVCCDLEGQTLYELSTDGDSRAAIDLSAASFPCPEGEWRTAEIAFLYRGGREVLWPESWIWMETEAADSPPTLEAGQHYRFAVRNEGNARIVINQTYHFADNGDGMGTL